jgi:hypothetical protein
MTLSKVRDTSINYRKFITDTEPLMKTQSVSKSRSHTAHINILWLRQRKEKLLWVSIDIIDKCSSVNDLFFKIYINCRQLFIRKGFLTQHHRFRGPWLYTTNWSNNAVYRLVGGHFLNHHLHCVCYYLCRGNGIKGPNAKILIVMCARYFRFFR